MSATVSSLMMAILLSTALLVESYAVVRLPPNQLQVRVASRRL